MNDSVNTLAVFVDYDNLLPLHKSAGLLDVVTKALVQLPPRVRPNRAKCSLRVYGGWYEGDQITQLAQDVAVEIQRDFPAIVRIPDQQVGTATISVDAELAVALLQEPGHHLFSTYRRKGKPSNVRVEKPQVIGCIDPACVLPMMKRLLKTGNCPKVGCTVSVGDLVFRHEQKLVDTMLACDMIHAATLRAEKVILISGDDDFLPPLRSLVLAGAYVARIHPKPNCQRATFPSSGPQLLEMDL